MKFGTRVIMGFLYLLTFSTAKEKISPLEKIIKIVFTKKVGRYRKPRTTCVPHFMTVGFVVVLEKRSMTKLLL
jgi:hypothetical protein